MPVARAASIRPAEHPGGLLRGPAIRRAAVEVLLAQTDRPEALHYRDWFDLVRAAGFDVAGKDPLAVFLTQLSRSPVIRRGTQAGVYELDVTRAARLGIALDRLHEDLRGLTARPEATADLATIRARREQLTLESPRPRRRSRRPRARSPPAGRSRRSPPRADCGESPVADHRAAVDDRRAARSPVADHRAAVDDRRAARSPVADHRAAQGDRRAARSPVADHRAAQGDRRAARSPVAASPRGPGRSPCGEKPGRGSPRGPDDRRAGDRAGRGSPRGLWTIAVSRGARAAPGRLQEGGLAEGPRGLGDAAGGHRGARGRAAPACAAGRRRSP